MENEVDSRLVSHQDGKWQVSHGPFESYDHLGENNWSLLVQAVNHWHEPTAALMRPFRALPDWRMDDLMISFSVPGGGVGRIWISTTCLSFRVPAAAAGAWVKKCR
jgi:50S ribosomal protein L16 3-hydroxylase